MEERKNQTRKHNRIKGFREWVDSMHLIDTALLGRRYTWNRGNSRSKIDRCLCDSEWLVTINAWFQYPSFRKLVEIEWSKQQAHHSSLDVKFKFLK